MTQSVVKSLSQSLDARDCDEANEWSIGSREERTEFPCPFDALGYGARSKKLVRRPVRSGSVRLRAMWVVV